MAVNSICGGEAHASQGEDEQPVGTQLQACRRAVFRAERDESYGSSSGRQQQVFGQHLSDDARSTRAHARSSRNLFLARRCPAKRARAVSR